MSPNSLETIFSQLNQHDVRYLVVGGLACSAHGHVRATMDLDIVVALDEANAKRMVEALSGLGYRPTAPVRAEEFVKKTTRMDWKQNKNMVVFQMVSGNLADTPVDIFVDEPFNFEKEYARAPRIEIASGIQVPIVHIEQLIRMKEEAGRAKDIADVETLKKINSPEIKIAAPNNPRQKRKQ